MLALLCCAFCKYPRASRLYSSLTPNRPSVYEGLCKLEKGSDENKIMAIVPTSEKNEKCLKNLITNIFLKTNALLLVTFSSRDNLNRSDVSKCQKFEATKIFDK
jgi:hypothetical protein